MFDPTSENQRRFNGLAGASIPDARDAELDVFVEETTMSGAPRVEATLSSISPRARMVMGSYAERAASRAVRQSSVRLITLGLVAVILAGMDSNAPEALMRMPLLEDASRRLGLDPAEVFEEASTIVGHPGRVNLMVWLTRDESDRTPESMGFEPAVDDTGFRYRYLAG